MHAAEITLAVISGFSGLMMAVYTAAGKTKEAAIIGGVGLFLCNVIWVLRLI
jgi:hypothetical protein